MSFELIKLQMKMLQVSKQKKQIVIARDLIFLTTYTLNLAAHVYLYLVHTLSYTKID